MRFVLSVLMLLITFSVLQTRNAYAQSASPAPLNLQQQLLEEQIKNQRAQAALYNKQMQGKSWRELFETVLSSAIGTLLGAAIALAGVFYSNKRQWRLEEKRHENARQLELEKWIKAQESEREKWARAKTEEMAKEARVAALELAKKSAAGLQKIIWLTWIARYEPDSLNEKEIADYDQEMKVILLDIVAAEVTVAALDRKAYQKLRSSSGDVLGIDHRMSKDIDSFKKEKTDQGRLLLAGEIGEFYLEAIGKMIKLTDELTEIFSALWSHDQKQV